MRIASFAYDLDTRAWSVPSLPEADSARTLVLAFGAPEAGASPEWAQALARRYPRSVFVGCSTAGEIHGTEVRDRSVAVTVTRFDRTDLMLAATEVASAADSFATGEALARKLLVRPGLRGVLVLSEGLAVNGSDLVRGLNAVLDPSIVVTGGLSGDGTAFGKTWVAIGSRLRSNLVAAVGLYGDHVQIGHGSKGGWDKFGPERIVTRSEGNVLHELDGKPALTLYEGYLGDKAKDLPASGLLFPLALRASKTDDKALVRTLLAVDRERRSLTFAGDIPRGYQAQLMKADFDRLIGGASLASAMAHDTGAAVGTEALVVAISCVGRRLVLGERTEEEVEAVLEALPAGGPKPHVTGFYSYGEISPFAAGHCDLHNQTMTLTVLSESATPLRRPAASGPARALGAPGAGDPFADLEVDRVTAAASVMTPAARTPPPPRKLAPPPPAPAAPAGPAARQPTGAGFRVDAFAYDLDAGSWSVPSFPATDSGRTLVLAFGAPAMAGAPEVMAELARAYPRSIVVGCSSAGEIHGTAVRDRSLAVTVTRFERTDLVLATGEVDGPSDSATTGEALARKLLARPGLRGVLVLSEGLQVNGSDLVRGLNRALDPSIVVTGGLSGDGTAFGKTWVAVGAKLRSNVVAAVGFYGDHVQIGHGSKGGWDKFGPERIVTRSEGNVLYELDGKPALTLYEGYLGDKAKDLPASGLLFPLALRATKSDDKALVRTLLAVDREARSLTFAGDIPRGHQAQLMKADFDRLIGGASLAAGMASEIGAPVGGDALVVAISCVGRRLVLGERTEEEVEAVLDALPPGPKAHITGFYSYGEISPYASGHCDLHNQTMTLTVFSESPLPLPRRAPAGATTSSAVTTRPPPMPAETDETRQLPSLREPPPPPASTPASPPPARRAARTVPSAASAVLATPAPSTAGGDSPAESSHGSWSPIATSVHPVTVPRSGPVTRLPPTPSGAAGAAVRKERRGDVTLVTVGGRLTESFKGEALGRELRGTVVFDLAGVERVTSFGVREWLSMLGAMTEVRKLAFVRCAEAVVNQLGMIKKFAGPAQIVSFFAPHLCGGCGEPFERGFDCERDADALREARVDAAPCPRCGGRGDFDDDAASYLAFAVPHAGQPVPAEIRAIADELDRAPAPPPRDAVDKTIEGDVTRLRVETRLGAALRWKKLLDGIEGALVVDLGAAAGIEPAGLTNLVQALSGLGREVTSIAIERCPQLLVERFAQDGAPPRVTVTSAVLDAHCHACAVHRPAIVGLAEHAAALAAGSAPRVHCKRCNGELELRGSEAAMRFLRRAAAPERKAASSPDVAPPSLEGLALQAPRAADPPSSPSLRPAAEAARRRPVGTMVAIAVLAVAVFGLGVRVLAPSSPDAVAATATPPPASAAPAPEASATAASTAWTDAADVPPPWVERPLVIDGEGVAVVGRGDLAATADASLAQARTDAITRLVGQIHRELAGTPVHAFVEARARDLDRASVEAVAARYLAQVGATATPERVDTALRQRPGGVEAFARYRLTRAAYDATIASYRETTNVEGMVVARYFPLLETTIRTDGQLVVVDLQRGRQADLAGTRAGDVVLGVGSRAVVTVDGLARAAREAWSAAAPRGSVTIDLESAGAKRSVQLWKPVPGAP